MQVTMRLLYYGMVLKFYRGNKSQNAVIQQWKRQYTKKQFDCCELKITQEDEFGVVPVMKASTKLL